MSSETSDSKRWSCGTLQDGVNHMDLALEEQQLLRQIQATIIFMCWLRLVEKLDETVLVLSFVSYGYPFHLDRKWRMNSLLWRSMIKIKVPRVSEPKDGCRYHSRGQFVLPQCNC